MQVILQYPIGFIAFCLLLGAIYTAILYYKTQHFANEGPQVAWKKYLLAGFRFLSSSIIAFLLLSPFIKTKFIEKIEPVIVYIHDNSESVFFNTTAEDSAKYIAETNEMLANLAKSYQIDYFAFDADVRDVDTLDFKGQSSNLSKALEQINGLYFNQNVGAVIFASDGIYNEGANPLYTEFNFPIYSIALGDTTQKTDAKITYTRANKIAYLDDKVQIEVGLQAHHLQGKSYQVSLQQKGNVLENKTVAIQKNFDEQKINFTINANSLGIQKYTIQIKSFDNEASFQNNTYDFFIEVIDNRQKILLIANAPHPDIAAIKAVVDLNKNYELDIQYAQKITAKVDDYSLVILHQLPSFSQRASNVLSAIKQVKLPIWWIVGASSQYNTFNQEQVLVQINPNGNNLSDAGAQFNTNFSSFTLSESSIQKLRKFPPIAAPFGTYKLGAGSQILLEQKIGSVATDFPLLVFQEANGLRSAAFVGEGLWRWKLHDYLDNQNIEAFQEIVEKTINYLAIKGDKRKFRVLTQKNIFYEGETIQFDGELYNDNYELINEPEVNMLIKSEDGNEFPLSFSKTSNAYIFETSSLPIGNYTYTAKTSFSGKNYTADGAFSIIDRQLEALQTQANHVLLQQLANKTQGQFFTAKELANIDEVILAKDSIKPTLYESFKTRSIINLFSIFLLIMALLSVEWFLRKYYGSY